MIDKYFYSKKVTRQVACGVLVGSDCNKLPIKLRSVLPGDRILILCDLSCLCNEYETSYEYLLDFYGPRGLVYYDGDKYYAYVNSDCDSKEYIYTVALILAYIHLDIMPVKNLFAIHEDFCDVTEFARYLLAPDCVLYECGIFNNLDIMNHTGLDFKNSLYKERELKNELLANRFYHMTSIEKFLTQKFSDFIIKYKDSRF